MRSILMPDITRLKNIVLLFIAVLGLSFSHVKAQEKVDRTVATIKIKDTTMVISIKHSDVMFQLAITPEVPLDPPTSKDFDLALKAVINQRLIHQFSGMGERPTDAEIRAELVRILRGFPSTQSLYSRVQILGSKPLQDFDLMTRVEQIAWMEKYLNSQFLSRIVVTPKEEEEHYQNVFSPEFRRRNPSAPVPELDKQRLQIREILTEARAKKAIGDFLSDLKQKAEITISEQSKPTDSNNQLPNKD